MNPRALTLDDIADMRAYERERGDFRARIIELKKRRRVSVGPYVTFVFENRDTIRFQIQEMARVERLRSDEQIEEELRIYNPLIPEPGMVSATMFIELTSDTELREWLPKLVNVDRSAWIRIGDGDGADRFRLVLDKEHEEQLTREDTTAAVHYVHAQLDDAQIERFAVDPVVLEIDHPAYRHETRLGPDTIAELLKDLRD
jgi:hypothetical protein